MKFKSILATALAAVVAFSSCSKDDTNGVDTPDNGASAKLGLTFTFPSETGTRANPEASNATGAESEIATVDVFLFTASGGEKTGGYNAFVKADFTETSLGSGVWVLNSTKNIETLSGDALIYVGVNLPTGQDWSSYKTEATLLAAVEALGNLTTANKFVMFSEKTSTNIKDESTLAVNNVSLDVKRVAAKVTVTRLNETYTMDWENADGLGGKLTYTFASFNLYQDAIKTYVAPNFAAGRVKTLIDDASYVDMTAAVADVLNPFGVADDYNGTTPALTGSSARTFAGIVDVTATGTHNTMYIGENAPLNPIGKNTTYAYIKTTVTANASAVLNSTKDEILWSGPAIAAGADIHVFKIDGVTYYANAANYAEIAAAAADALNTDIADIDADSYFIYQKGYVYFRTLLNKVDTNDYQVKRNQYIDVIVNGVNMAQNVFPGYPGNPVNPEIPVDPTEPNSPENPNPHPVDPEEPIDGSKAMLNVTVNVQNWDYTPSNTWLD